MATPPVHESKEHRRLRHLLERYKFSVAELEWFQRHVKGWPPSLESLLRTKLKEALGA